jgi:hypothetical protein
MRKLILALTGFAIGVTAAVIASARQDEQPTQGADRA